MSQTRGTRAALTLFVLIALLVATWPAQAASTPMPPSRASAEREQKGTPVATGVREKGPDDVVLVTPPHCDDTGCAVAKPGDFVIKLPWDDATSHTVINAYGTGLHQGVCRTSAVNDYHALDFDLNTGDNVRAIAAGQVVYAGWATGGWSSFGQIVIIDHQNGYQSMYAHLNVISVSDNQWVQQKEKVGEAGGTGGWSPHLHFSLYHAALVADPGGPYGGCATVPEYFHGAQDYENLATGMVLTSESGGDTTPPTASWVSPSDGQVIYSGIVHLAANASDDSSGVNRVSFTAKWSGNWYGLAVVTSSPYQYDWDWCGSGVPDGDVELGLEAWDNAGNHYVYSEHYPNYHITKSYACSPSCSPNSDQVALYADANYGGSCVTLGSGDYPNPGTLGAVGNDNAESVRVGSNVQAVLCQHDNFEGTCETFTGDDSNLADNPIGANVVSSARVQQRAQAPATPTLQSPGNGSSYNEGTDLSLAWNDASGATEYYAEFWGGPAGTLNSGWQGATSWHIGSQWSGYTYLWHVKARNSSGESSWSDSWSFTVNPAPPSNLQAYAASCTQVNLSWSDNSGNEEGYNLYRDGSYIGAVGMNGTSYQDAGVAPDTSFSYAVRAFRGGVESDPATASTSTPPCGGAVYRSYLPVVAKVQREAGRLTADGDPADGEVGKAYCADGLTRRNAPSGNSPFMGCPRVPSPRATAHHSIL